MKNHNPIISLLIALDSTSKDYAHFQYIATRGPAQDREAGARQARIAEMRYERLRAAIIKLVGEIPDQLRS